MKYWFNTSVDSVRMWRVTDVSNSLGTYASPGYFPAGRLAKNVTVDEAGRQIIEFKDKEGLMILRKLQFTSSSDNGTGKVIRGG
ncbi:MAG: hypothetical protein WDO71_19495 [Bacteroidota bacterium]